MRKSQITPEVIKLSKEIAEHWRMEIYPSCWVIGGKGEKLLITGVDSWQYYYYESGYGNTSEGKEHTETWFPIPSISDCLEKLRELGHCYRLQDVKGGYQFGIWDDPEDNPLSAKVYKSPLRASLSALLEVLMGKDKIKDCVCECVKWNDNNKVTQCHRCGRIVKKPTVMKRDIRKWLEEEWDYSRCFDDELERLIRLVVHLSVEVIE